jgi:hypothetical protein
MAELQQIEVPDDFGNPWMSNLEEIGVPEPVSFTPQTAGWYLLAGVALVIVVWFVWRFYWKWRANAYRREGLRELGEIEGLIEEEATGSRALQSIPELLKRVALAAYPRSRVAELSGDAWLGFLDGTVGSTEFTRGLGRLLPGLAYDPAAAAKIAVIDSKDLVALAGAWIRHHKPGSEASDQLKRPVPLPAGAGGSQAPKPLGP